MFFPLGSPESPDFNGATGTTGSAGATGATGSADVNGLRLPQEPLGAEEPPEQLGPRPGS